LRFSCEPWSPPSVRRTSEVDGVIEQGATGGAVARDGAGACAGVDLGRVDGALYFAGAIGVVGEKIDVDVEGDEECLVLGGEDVLEELCSRLLLEGKYVHLAAAGVEEDADGEGEVFFLGEVFGLLKIFVLVDAAVVFVEVGEEAVLVADGEVDVDEVDVDLEGLDVVLIDGLSGGIAGWGRAARGGCLLRVEGGDDTESECCGGEAGKAHTPLDDEVRAEFEEKCVAGGAMERNAWGRGCVQEEWAIFLPGAGWYGGGDEALVIC